MRVVLDTNILLSALMIHTGNPAAIYRAWQEGRFTLLTCAEVGSSRVDLQACKLEYSIVSPK